jgi:hypothetical protein
MDEPMEYEEEEENEDEEEGDWDNYGVESPSPYTPLEKDVEMSDTASIWSTDKSKFPYRFISGNDVIGIQNKRIAQLVDDTGVSEVLARSLLIVYGWNPELATRELLDKTCEGIFKFKFADKTEA